VLRRGSRLVNQAMSPGEVTSALHKIAAESLSAGWIACESGMQSELLTQCLTGSSNQATRPQAPNQGRIWGAEGRTKNESQPPINNRPT
jgi:hypothetical protein